MAARAARTLSTNEWTLKVEGRVVIFSARRLNSATGSAVSQLAVHFFAQVRRPVSGVLALEVGQHWGDRVAAFVSCGQCLHFPGC